MSVSTLKQIAYFVEHKNEIYKNSTYLHTFYRTKYLNPLLKGISVAFTSEMFAKSMYIKVYCW
jgi:hypothetical protein